MRETDSKAIGQFFTPDHFARFMVCLASAPKGGRVLEPACGDGAFFRALAVEGYTDVTGYEIDESLNIRGPGRVQFESFVTARLEGNFDLVIGNPPYVRWKNLDPSLKAELLESTLWLEHCNSLSDYLSVFVLKGIDSLREGGELIFVTPEYWVSTTHSQNLRDYIASHGYIERFYHFCETKVFSSVASSIVVFKFVKTRNALRPAGQFVKFDSKSKLSESVLDLLLTQPDQVAGATSFQFEQFSPGERWAFADSERHSRLRAFEAKCAKQDQPSLFGGDSSSITTLGDIAEIGNGLVSGLDRAFQTLLAPELSPSEKAALVPVLKAKDLRPYGHGPFTYYFLLNERISDEEELRTDYPNFYRQLARFRELLESRYSYGRGIPYWEWVFLRNFLLFNRPGPRIFVPCKERVSHKDHFRFSIAPHEAFPTQDVTAIVPKPQVRESVEYLTAFLNHRVVYDWIITKGVIKGNVVEFCEKPLARIPIRLIDWNNLQEVQLHDHLTELSRAFARNPSPETRAAIDSLISSLL